LCGPGVNSFGLLDFSPRSASGVSGTGTGHDGATIRVGATRRNNSIGIGGDSVSATRSNRIGVGCDSINIVLGDIVGSVWSTRSNIFFLGGGIVGDDAHSIGATRGDRFGVGGERFGVGACTVFDPSAGLPRGSVGDGPIVPRGTMNG